MAAESFLEKCKRVYEGVKEKYKKEGTGGCPTIPLKGGGALIKCGGDLEKLSVVTYKNTQTISCYPISAEAEFAISAEFSGCLFAVGQITKECTDFKLGLYAFHIPPQMYDCWAGLVMRLGIAVKCILSPIYKVIGGVSPDGKKGVYPCICVYGTSKGDIRIYARVDGVDKIMERSGSLQIEGEVLAFVKDRSKRYLQEWQSTDSSCHIA